MVKKEKSKMTKHRKGVFFMAEILHIGKRLQLRKATMADLDFIMKLEYDP